MNKPGKLSFWDKIHIYYGPEWDQEINLGLTEQKKCFEVHADGVKEVKCDSCSEPCGNEWCCMKEQNDKN